MKRAEKKKYYKLEQQLKSKYKHIRENELILVSADFKDNTLKNSAFVRIKDECWYIPYGERVVIRVPDSKQADVQADLGFFAARVLSKIKKDRQEALIHSIVLFVVGISILGILSSIWGAIYHALFITELVTIVSWVFVWAGVSKWFIEERVLQDRRFTVLQLLSADIIRYDEHRVSEVEVSID